MNHTINYFTIGNESISFPGDNPHYAVQYPMSPMVSSFSTTEEGVHKIFVRLIVFLDSDIDTIREHVALSDTKPEEVDVKILYNSPNENPSSFKVWFIDLDIRPGSEVVKTVSARLENEDPKTSRGTITVVQKQ